jgi:hypothetical protein
METGPTAIAVSASTYVMPLSRCLGFCWDSRRVSPADVPLSNTVPRVASLDPGSAVPTGLGCLADSA